MAAWYAGFRHKVVHLMTKLPHGAYSQYHAKVVEALERAADDVVDDVVEAAFADGYRAGFDAGAAQMRDVILRAAQMPQATTAPLPISAQMLERGTVGESNLNGRARRGAVRQAIVAALSETPGLTEKELGQAMEKVDPTVSGRSAGGELRRLIGRLYRQEAGRWFLVGNAGDRKTAESSDPAVPATSETQEEPDASEASIAA